MLNKRTIQLLKSLKNKADRQDLGFFLAEGNKTSLEILNSNLHTETIFATQNWIEQNPSFKNNTKIVICTPKEIAQISSLKSAQDIVIQVKAKENLPYNYNQHFTLVLDEIQDPGNLGTIIRIADWYGIKSIVCSENTADCYNNKCIQATMGSIARVGVYYIDLDTFFLNNKLPVYGAFMEGTPLKNTLLNPNSVLVIGNEGKGINKNLHGFITKKISIERIGKAESLNAGIATAIICDKFFNS